MKHAFLIMAHADYSLLCRLLRKLDHPDNAIYIHIDAKSDFSENDANLLNGSCRFSKIEFIKRINYTWGGYSQIECMLRLLEAAVKDNNDYYHYLTGIDFPIKAMEYIHKFFETNKGKEFVHFCTDDFAERFAFRFTIYHLFDEKIGKERKGIYNFAERVSHLLQRHILKLDRTRKYSDIVFKGGSVYSSVTHSFAKYLLEREPSVKRMFGKSYCCDEFFLQTMIYNSPYRENLYVCNVDGIDTYWNMRSIDWERGTPYVLDIDDYEALVASDNLFCRKVSDKTPKHDMLVQRLEEL